LVVSLPVGLAVPAAGDEFVGRWDINIPMRDGRTRACWLEVTRDGEKLKARFLAGSASPFELKKFSLEEGELRWEHLSGRPPDQFTTAYRARVKDGQLEGTVTPGNQAPISWTGVRAPVWPDKFPKKKPGRPIALFNGKDLSGWLPQVPSRPLRWTVKDGAMANDPPANNIYSERKFQDFKLEVEFNVSAHGNSGIYLRGRHEIQVLDDFGRQPDEHSHGAIYGFIAPRVNAGRQAGEWQTLEATLIGNRVTVVLNGVKIHDNVAIPAITGGALDANEAQPGPIMLQGDHEGIMYRKVVVTPLE